ncbi:MAG: HEAT repeat domain-containing protein, partial [Planctomycetota bacterium]
MRNHIALAALSIALLLPAELAAGGYRVCTQPVPADAPPEVQKQILRLRHASPTERGYAAFELYKMGPKAAPAAPFLKHLLADDAPLTSYNTVGGMKWVGRTTPGMLAAKALWVAKPDEIVDVLRHGPATSRLHATRILGGTAQKPEGISALRIAVRDESAAVREAAVIALGRSPKPRATDAVRDALGDAAPAVRARAVEALGRRKDAESLPALLRILANDKDPWPRGYAAWYVGQIGDREAVTPLIRALNDRSAYVRRYAASSLGVLGDARAVEALMALAGDPDAEVRREVGDALARFDDPRISAAEAKNLGNADADARCRAVAAVGRYPDTYAAELIACLDDPDADVRRQAAESLGWARARGPQAARALAGHLRNTDDERFIRETTLLRALQHLGDAAVEELETILLSAPTTNRFGQTRDPAPQAARALGEIGTAKANAALQRGASAPSAAARKEVERLRMVRRYRRPPARPARRASGNKPKPRKQPQPPHVAAAGAPGPAPTGGGPARPAPTGTGGGGRYRLTGVIGSSAILNGKIVQVGDTVAGAKVVRIGRG